MQSLKPLQRAVSLVAAALLSVVIAEAIIGHAFDADPQVIVAQAGRGQVPVVAAHGAQRMAAQVAAANLAR